MLFVHWKEKEQFTRYIKRNVDMDKAFDTFKLIEIERIYILVSEDVGISFVQSVSKKKSFFSSYFQVNFSFLQCFSMTIFRSKIEPRIGIQHCNERRRNFKYFR